MSIKSYSKLTTTAIAGGVLCVSIASIFAIRRYFVLKDLKEDLGIIPWDTKDVTWRHYFKVY